MTIIYRQAGRVLLLNYHPQERMAAGPATVVQPERPAVQRVKPKAKRKRK